METMEVFEVLQEIEVPESKRFPSKARRTYCEEGFFKRYLGWGGKAYFATDIDDEGVEVLIPFHWEEGTIRERVVASDGNDVYYGYECGSGKFFLSHPSRAHAESERVYRRWLRRFRVNTLGRVLRFVFGKFRDKVSDDNRRYQIDEDFSIEFSPIGKKRGFLGYKEWDYYIVKGGKRFLMDWDNVVDEKDFSSWSDINPSIRNHLLYEEYISDFAEEMGASIEEVEETFSQWTLMNEVERIAKERKGLKWYVV